MTTLSIHESAREEARLSTGRFGVQEHTAPETAFTGPTPKQLAMAGFGGPASVNVLAESWDEHDDRPLRPYLALRHSDDDEFFDARPGSRLNIIQNDADGNASTRSFVRSEREGVWEERSDLRDTWKADITSGELWGELFEENGAMRSNLLHAPNGVLFSDERYYVSRDDIDKPLTVDDAIYRLSGGSRGQLVSRSIFGDTRKGGIPSAYQGELVLDVSDTGYLSYSRAEARRGESREFSLDNVQIFDRDGDLVFRVEHDAGYGFEETFRVTD